MGWKECLYVSIWKDDLHHIPPAPLPPAFSVNVTLYDVFFFDYIPNEVKDEVKEAIGNLNGEFNHLDEMVKNKIEAAEKWIKDDINNKFKINDEVVDKKMESLTNTVKDLQTENSKLKAEVI